MSVIFLHQTSMEIHELRKGYQRKYGCWVQSVLVSNKHALIVKNFFRTVFCIEKKKTSAQTIKAMSQVMMAQVSWMG